MAVTVNMPQLGETVTEGTILSWAKQPGDTIAEDEVLLEISTDKVDTEIPSPAAGVVHEILVPEGETVEVGTPLVVIADPGEEVAAAPVPVVEEPEVAETEAVAVQADPEPAPAPEPIVAPPPAATPVATPAAGEEEPRRSVLSPVVRKLAAEYGLDLESVPGTGSGGRITRKDVMAFIDSGGAAAPAAKVTLEPAPEPAVAAPPAHEPAAVPAPPAPSAASGDEVVELSRIRKTIAANMTRSKQTAAHVWTSVEVDFENVERVRRAHRSAFKDREGFSLTYMPFIGRATMDALRAFPVVNSSLSVEDATATFHGSIHLGIAVDMNEGGLIVTTIRDADQMRMTGLAREVRRLATKTKAGNIELDDITPSTFTITNPGPFGSFMSAPIINVPNVAILSTDTVAKRPAVVTLADGSDAIAIRHIGYLGLTWDHRAFDGSTAVLFLNRIKESLETWDWGQELS
jgi:2-oxoglutarate dehydrogenase E2 component (dihydrolipoamide succinyltransferase)